MGFTWIFAFVAAFTGMEAFWYIYIVLNSFQGLYIFLAFTANSMVWGLWRRKLGLSESSSKTRSTSNRNRSGGAAEDPRQSPGQSPMPAADSELSQPLRQSAAVPSDTQI